ncbi:PH domain-containing protein [Clostridium sp. DL1XJH146]
MSTYKCYKLHGVLHILGYLVLTNIIFSFFTKYINIYEIVWLANIFQIVYNLYLIYSLLLLISLKIVIKNDLIIIEGIFSIRKIKIPIEDVQAYFVDDRPINGVRLYGIGSKKFALGRMVIEEIGTTRMFTTCHKIIYLKTKDINFAISPMEIGKIEEVLKKQNVRNEKWEYINNDTTNFHDKKEITLLVALIGIIIVIFTFTPLILDFLKLLPSEMPLSINSKLEVIAFGTGEKFAFKQLIYGIINMGILLCMYFAAYSHVKYDEKTAYMYLYASLIISFTFFILQFIILLNFVGDKI